MSLLEAAKIALVVALVYLGARYWWQLSETYGRQKPPQPPRAGVPTAPSPPPRIYAPDPETRLAEFRRLEREATANPALRQEFAGQVLAQLPFRMWSGHDRWQAELWAVLLPHLRPGWDGFWPGIDIRVDCARLADLDFSGCEVRDLTFSRVRFEGRTRFKTVRCTGEVSFDGCCFAWHARFAKARFANASFAGTTFTGTADFREVTVTGPASFPGARFSGHADFTGARFGPFTAIGAGFAGRASFRDTRFAARARFADARFTGPVDFTGASFVDGFGPGRAWVRTDSHAARAWPEGWTPGTGDRVLLKRPGRWAEVRFG